MKNYKIGYTQGVYDMFHIGHLNLINNAKTYCEILIVGVNADSLVMQYKNKVPVVKQEERKEIIANLKAVDQAVIVTSLDKAELYKQFHFDAVFIGDDWKGTARWIQTEKDLKPLQVDVVYLPYTKDVSSTVRRNVKDDIIRE